MALRDINIYYVESFADKMLNGEVFHMVDRNFLNTHFIPIVRKQLAPNYTISGTELFVEKYDQVKLIKNIISSTLLMKELEKLLKAC